MLVNVKLNSNGYTKVYGSKNISIAGGYSNDIEVLEWVENGGVIADEFTATEIEDTRVLDITAKATELIEVKYSPLKQRKMLSIAVALQDKILQSETLTADEEALMQNNRDANVWITTIRTIENVAITDGTLLANINWTV